MSQDYRLEKMKEFLNRNDCVPSVYTEKEIETRMCSIIRTLVKDAVLRCNENREWGQKDIFWPIKEMKFRIAFIVIALCRLTGENPTVCITNVMKRIASYWKEEIKSRGYEDIPLDLSPFRGEILLPNGWFYDHHVKFPDVDGFDSYSLIYVASDMINIRPYRGDNPQGGCPSINIPDPWDGDLPAGMVQGVIASVIQDIAFILVSEFFSSSSFILFPYSYCIYDHSPSLPWQSVGKEMLKGKADLAFLGYLIAHYSKTDFLGKEISSAELQAELQRIYNEVVDLVGLERPYKSMLSARQQVLEKLLKGEIDLAFLLKNSRYLIDYFLVYNLYVYDTTFKNIQLKRLCNEVVALGLCSTAKKISSEEIQREVIRELVRFFEERYMDYMEYETLLRNRGLGKDIEEQYFSNFYDLLEDSEKKNQS